MSEHPEVSIGIFISLNTRIVGKNHEIPISIEWIHDSQCAIFIHSFKELEIKSTLALLDQIIKITGVYKKIITSTGDISEGAILQPRIDKARIHIDQYISESSASMMRIKNDKKRHLDLIESTYLSTITSMKTQGTAIATVLSILTGEYIEDMNIDPTLIPDPEALKTEAAKPKKSTKK
jgi:hypothetical protein